MSIRTRLPRHDDDRGFTLAEVLVSMGLLSIFMALFTAATALMTDMTTKVQRITAAVTQANQTYIALDKSVRYASGISPVRVSPGGVWHVEFDTNIAENGTSRDVCTQLRVANRQLQQRTWTVSGSGYAAGSLTAWRVLSSNVTNGTLPANSASTDRPFTVPVANAAAASQFQQLTITVVAAGVDTTAPTETNRATMTFAAVNSVAGNPASFCQQVPVDMTT